ncbi:NUDIX hydrolase [Phenylobacterium deserti]|uniref:NUDIX hydrolase n=1 Tax=Phenylobacterium deserti TaxID=1914756 RepID=UPI003B84681E
MIEVVGAVIRDEAGRLLTVRKAGTSRFMLPGGKPEPGEALEAALPRELEEELGLQLARAELLGRFEAPAANEPGAIVRSSAFLAAVEGEPRCGAEIAEMRWIDPAAPAVSLAPLLADHILPALQASK